MTTIRKTPPDLILLDIMMPVMDGDEATSAIRSKLDSSSNNDIKIIGLTASAFPDHRDKSLEWEVDGFVTKPFKESDIFDALIKHLGVTFDYHQEDENEVASARAQEFADSHGQNIKLPENLFNRLIEATELSDVEQIDQVIMDIGEYNPALANKLTKMADSFAYDKIVSFCIDLRTKERRMKSLYLHRIMFYSLCMIICILYPYN